MKTTRSYGTQVAITEHTIRAGSKYAAITNCNKEFKNGTPILPALTWSGLGGCDLAHDMV